MRSRPFTFDSLRPGPSTRRPENSGSARALRTLDMVDMSAFGRTRRAQLTDLSVGITAPLGLSARETGEIARKAMIRMAEDHSFTAAETDWSAGCITVIPEGWNGCAAKLASTPTAPARGARAWCRRPVAELDRG